MIIIFFSSHSTKVKKEINKSLNVFLKILKQSILCVKLFYLICLNIFFFSFFQFSVRASDQYNPPKTAICSVQIDVIRDQNLPKFLQPFIFQTDELKSPGSFVGNIQAIDPDNNVIQQLFSFLKDFLPT